MSNAAENTGVPVTIDMLRARYKQLCAKRDAIEERIAPLRAELREKADIAEQHRVAAMEVAKRLDEARGGKQWFALKKEIGLLAKVIGPVQPEAASADPQS